MERVRKSEKDGTGSKLLAILLVLLTLYPVAVYAAGSIVLSRPVPGGPGSGYGWRGSRPHKGTDYPRPVGTNVPIPPGGITCHFQGRKPEGEGWGQYAKNVQKCDSGGYVTQLFAHLSVCQVNPPVMKTGGGVGTYGSGRTTGPHLHYEIWLPDGTRVDAEQAYGKNLCDPAVQRTLAADAQRKNRGRAGGSASTAPTTNPSTPPSGGGTGTGGPTTPPPPVIITPPPPAGPPYTPAPLEDPIDPGPFPPTTDDIVPGTVTDNEVTGCSTEVWRAMVNRSVLQTRREMLTNERYIAKADSVMPYACFEDFYWHAADKAGVFSETERWHNATIDIMGRTVTVDVYMGVYSLDGAIATAVDGAVEVYLNNNFDHDWLGQVNQPINAAYANLDPYSDAFNAIFGGGGGADADDHDDDGHGHSETQYQVECGKMREVWQMAKCMNVEDDPLFYRFEDLVGFDPRIFPRGYECTDSGITQTMISRANHEEVTKEIYTAYFDILRPENDECAPPIPTGVQVTIRTGADRITQEKTYDDALCITAGCSYQNPSSSGLGTCEIKQP